MIGTQVPCRQGLDLHGSTVTETQRSGMYQIYQLLAHVQCKYKLNNINWLCTWSAKDKTFAIKSCVSACSKGFKETAQDFLLTYTKKINVQNKLLDYISHACMLRDTMIRYSPEVPNIVTYQRFKFFFVIFFKKCIFFIWHSCHPVLGANGIFPKYSDTHPKYSDTLDFCLKWNP